MAVNAAHLTRTLNEKPSIFEVIAQESLQNTIQPALKRLLEFITSFNPRKSGWILKWYDELYFIFNSALQYKYLRNYAASFSESFYGLKRISMKSPIVTNGFYLSQFEEKMSLILLVMFPYLRQKMDQLAQKYTYDEIDGITPKDWRGKFQKFFIMFRSTFHLIYEFLSLVQFLAYISGKSNSHSPLLRIISLSLTYAPNVESNDVTWSDFWNNMTKGNISSAKITFDMISTTIIRTLEVGAFFIQFVKWWEDKGPLINMNIMPVPEPPKADVRALQYTNKCPICFQQWKMPTVLPVSGYVFCYVCIIRHLNEEDTCPVTKYHAKKESLIRIYT